MFDVFRSRRLHAEVERLTARAAILEGGINDLEAERARLLKVNEDLEKTNRDLAHKKKLEEEDIKHMVRLQQERDAVLAERRELELERKKDEAIAEVKKEYQGKLEALLNERLKEFREMYTEILARLPNISASMKLRSEA